MAVARPQSNIPVPDPSILTTENLRREVGSLRELIESKLDAMNAVRALLIENVKTIPTLISTEVTRLRELEEAKTNALEQRFTDADLRYRERFEASDLRYQQRYDASDKALAAANTAAGQAVTAALAAAKEAVQAASVSAEKSVAAQNESNAASILKSEVSVTKQIDSIMTLLTTSAKTLDEKIAGINSRLDRGEGVQKGGFDTRTAVIALVVVTSAVVGVVINYTSSFRGSQPAVYAPASYGAPSYYGQQSAPPQQHPDAPPPQVSVVPVVPVPVPH